MLFSFRFLHDDINKIVKAVNDQSNDLAVGNLLVVFIN